MCKYMFEASGAVAFRGGARSMLDLRTWALCNVLHVAFFFRFLDAIVVLTIKLMMIIKLLLDVSTLSSIIFKSCKVTVTWQFE